VCVCVRVCACAWCGGMDVGKKYSDDDNDGSYIGIYVCVCEGNFFAAKSVNMSVSESEESRFCD
jgi:hypothetical protein